MLSDKEKEAIDELKRILADGAPNTIFTTGKEIDLARWSMLPSVPNRDTWYQDIRRVEGLQFVLWREIETRVANMWDKWNETITAMVSMAEVLAGEPESETIEEKVATDLFPAQQSESSLTSKEPEGSFDPWGIGL